MKENPDDPAPRIALARLLLLQGKGKEALDTVQPSLTKYPKNPSLIDVVGRAQLALNNPTAAISTFNTLVAEAPKSSPAHEDLAEAYGASNNIELALTEARKAVALDPKNENAQLTLVRLLANHHDYGEAGTIIASLSKTYPKDHRVPELAGLLALAQNRPQDAIVAFQSALALNDNGVDRTRLAIAQMHAGHGQEAEKTLLDWLAEHKQDTVARMNLADFYMSNNRLAEAKTQYEQIIQQVPNNVIAENNLAWVLSQLGQPKEALAHAQHAAAGAPNNPQVLDTLGIVLLQNQKADDAVTKLRSAVQAAPNSPEIQFHLAQALVGAGSKTEARTVLQKLLANYQSFNDRQQAQKLLATL